MNCRKIYQALSAYMDGELPGVDALVVRQHLTSCDACRAEYEGLRQTKQLLSRLRMKEPRPDLPQDIVRRLQLENTRAANLSIDAIWEGFAQKMRVIPPAARSFAFGASLAVLGFGFIAVQPEGPDDTIHWNVASSTPLAPAPALDADGADGSGAGYVTNAAFDATAGLTPPAALLPADMQTTGNASGTLAPALVSGGGQGRTFSR